MGLIKNILSLRLLRPSAEGLTMTHKIKGRIKEREASQATARGRLRGAKPLFPTPPPLL